MEGLGEERVTKHEVKLETHKQNPVLRGLEESEKINALKGFKQGRRNDLIYIFKRSSWLYEERTEKKLGCKKRAMLSGGCCRNLEDLKTWTAVLELDRSTRIPKIFRK